MAEILLAGVLGAVVTILAILIHHLKETDRQLSALRVKVAKNTLAIGANPTSDAPHEQVVRRKRHLGLIKGGGAVAVVAWLLRRTREQLLAVAATGAAAIMAAGAFALLDDGDATPDQPAHHPLPAAHAPRSTPTEPPDSEPPTGPRPSAHGPGTSPTDIPTESADPMLAGESPAPATSATTGSAPLSTAGPGPSSATTAPTSPGPSSTPPTATHCVTADLDPLADLNLCLPGRH